MIRKSYVSRGVSLCCSVFALMATDFAYAQSTETEAVGLSDIIVTAQRREERLQDVPLTVNVVTGQQIEKLNIFDIKDIQQLVPGLEMTNTSGRNNTATLRGISFDPDQGTNPAVQIFWNDVAIDAQNAFTAIYDVGQIEVLRGPHGLMRGLGAPAGSITITTRRPNFDKIEGYMQATATDRAGYNVQGGVSLPFSDKLAIRVAGLVDGNRLNNVTDINRDQRSRSRTESARITLGWQPSEAFTAYLTYQYLYADNRMFTQVVGSGNNPAYNFDIFFSPAPTKNPAFVSGPPLTASDYSAVAEGLSRFQNRTHNINLHAEYDLGGSLLTFSGAHQDNLITIQRDLDPANAVPTYIATGRQVTPTKIDSGELRWRMTNDEGLALGLSAAYGKGTGPTVVDQPADNFLYPIDPTLAFNRFPVSAHITVPVHSEIWGIGANARFKTGRLTIEGAIGRSVIKAIQTTQQTLFLGPYLGGPQTIIGPTEIIPANLQRRTNKPITGGVTVSYAFADTLNGYASYGHAFRPGTTGVAIPAGLSDDLIRTRPEKTDSFEVGLKGSLMDRKVSFTVAAYYQNIKDFLTRFTGIYYNCPEVGGQCSVAGPPINNATQVANGAFDFNYNADARVKGVEGSIDARFVENWDLNVSAAYTRARFKNALVPCNDFDGSGSPNLNGTTPVITGSGNVSYCQSNGRLAEVPDFSMSATTEVRFPVGEYTPFVRALFSYRPGFHSERVVYDYQSRHLLNLFVGLRGPDGKWELTGFARNLLNEKRITNITQGNVVIPTSQPTLNGIVPYDSGYRLVNVTNPREFGVTLNFKW